MIGSEKMGWLSTSNNQFCESWLPVALSGMIHDQNGPSLYLIGIIGSVNGMNCFRFISYLKPPQQLLVHVPLSNNIQIHIYIYVLCQYRPLNTIVNAIAAHIYIYLLYAGWWFGTCYHILGMSSSQLTFIFSVG